MVQLSHLTVFAYRGKRWEQFVKHITPQQNRVWPRAHVFANPLGKHTQSGSADALTPIIECKR